MTRRSIVVAPDKFKGSLSALEVALAIERGLRAVFAERYEIERIPMADGGEGTVDAFIDGGAVPVRRIVRGPRGAPVEATFARDGETVVIEMASASGLALLASEERNAREATTFGTGELILAALDAGAKHIVVGIGGSATNDAGAGMLVALGARLTDASGEPLPPGGVALAELADIDISGLDARLRDATLEVAADVDNPLCGPAGASAIFGPQKGATPADVAALDRALHRFADVSAYTVGRDERERPGAGAAGGLGFAFLAFLGARLRPGVQIVAELRRLEPALACAALCLTGEGRIDGQTLHGKTVAGVAALARAKGVPVVALGGSVEPHAENDLAALGITCFPVTERPMPLSAALDEAAALVERATSRIARMLEVRFPEF